MKNYIKGIITGIIIGAVVCSIPALADTIDALFNNVRISVNGVDQIQWGENIQLADGAETPASILYNGTTYLPMRKLGELSGNKIYWNGDSRTVGMTGAQKDIKVIAEKPDKNGNVWKYYTFRDNDDKTYLGVKDEARGYERVYLMASGSIRMTDNEIYFVRLHSENGYQYTNGADLVKLPFENEPDNQDGEKITTLKSKLPTGTDIDASIIDDNVIFDGEYLYYACRIQGNSYGCDQINAYNYITGERIEKNLDRYHLSDMKLSQSDEQSAVLKYVFNTGTIYDCEITFDKTTNTFIKE